MSFRSVSFVASSCATFAACLGSFVIGYHAGYLEALHEGYFRPAVVREKAVDMPFHTAPENYWRGNDQEAGEKLMAMTRRCFTADASRITIMILRLSCLLSSVLVIVLHIHPVASLWRWPTSTIGPQK